MRMLGLAMALAAALMGPPLAAQDATQQAAQEPASAPTPAAAPAGSAALEPAQPVARSQAGVGSDIIAAPPPTIELAPPPPRPPPITLVLNADLGAQRLTVVENGKSKYTWAISSGRRGFATPMGTFQPIWAAKMWYSRQYEYAPMPNAVFFHRGTAFHGTSAVGLLGQPASHGCVRLAPGNAAALFKLVHKHGFASTKVVVHTGSRQRQPNLARRGRPGEMASERAGRGAGTRVSRAAQRRGSNWED
jgi:lipoprotein-anchoring transpeptidase ErfK/SrfK